ncbi:sulfotransferase 1A3-like [Tubulanus polymorphus]|uniref:sulfotransferase 1A3-like n=1 Tax=Tubulanus polymorphus TaxID=672921 RepID=UPI003DA1DE8B
MQTHFPFGMFPIQAREKKTKVIYVLRNPNDTLVSFYHFHQLTYQSLGKICQDNTIFPFIREGNIGGWKNHFTVASRHFVRLHFTV